MNRKTIIIGVGLFMIIIVFGGLCAQINTFNHTRIEYRKTREAIENQLLKEVSYNLNMEFESWFSLREYVYCELLYEGMSRNDAERSLLEVGEIYPFENIFSGEEIRFKNETLDYYLAPIKLNFDGGGSSGKLVSWYASDEHHFSAPRASCEQRENK